MKHCNKCNRDLSDSKFYKSNRNKDGLRSRCKDCQREDGKIYNRMPERREYNKKFYQDWYKKNAKQYYSKPDVKQRQSQNQRRYYNDPILSIRHRARWMARKAVEQGLIVKMSCQKCGSNNSQIHHPNYYEPLNIIWLCIDCHRKEHGK